MHPVKALHALLLGGLLATASLAHAAGPMPKGQAPGWYRMMLGDFEVTALSDGTVALPWDKLLVGPKPRIAAALRHEHMEASPQETSVNGYLVNTGSKLVLIDAGAAGLFGPTLGRLVKNLEASGYKPEQVDEIYVTHLHADHVAGITGADGKPVFPNAVVRLHAQEAAFWLDAANKAKAPEPLREAFDGASISMKPYVDAGRMKTFDGAVTELVPGIRAIAAKGHTPGHTIYEVTSNGATMVMWGDIMHSAAVQFPNPDITVQFDSDQKSARVQRQKAYADAARRGYYAAVAHVSFPGIGKLRPDGKGYRWLPANYTANLPPPAPAK
jgi:glyoxylase-like metal-dependent hydrolase (beta-lactamase superfamily II)